MIHEEEPKRRNDARTLRRRLKIAFERLAELEGVRIRGRQKYWCCMNCGCHAAADEFKSCDLFVFYHDQDDEKIPHFGSVNLAYFSPKGRDDDIADLMDQHVLPVLRDCGLDITWNGSASKRPEVRVRPGSRVGR